MNTQTQARLVLRSRPQLVQVHRPGLQCEGVHSIKSEWSFKVNISVPGTWSRQKYLPKPWGERPL